MAPRTFIVPGIGNLTVGCEAPTRLRLADTCFRSGGEPLAGNFLLWRNLDELLEDDGFMRPFVGSMITVLATIDGDRDRKNYFTVQHNRLVGWSSTERLAKFKPEDLEPFAPNGGCTGLRVKLPSDHLAPLTDLVTFCGDFMRIGSCWNLVLFTVYPGRSVGPLVGNVTQRTGEAFFRFSHPGVLPNP